jgi:hypothetical protein
MHNLLIDAHNIAGLTIHGTLLFGVTRQLLKTQSPKQIFTAFASDIQNLNTLGQVVFVSLYDAIVGKFGQKALPFAKGDLITIEAEEAAE